MRSARLRGVFALCALLGLAGCGGSGKSGYVYLASGTNPGLLTTYHVDLGKGTLDSSNGGLTPTGKSVNTGTQPGPMIFDSTNTFAFVADLGSPLDPGSDNTKKNGDIAAFSIGKAASISSIGLTSMPAYTTATIPSGCATLSPVGLALDPSGKFLFVADQAYYNADASATCTGLPANGTRAPGVLVVFGVASGNLTPLSVNAIPVPPAAPGTNIPQPTSVAVSNQGSFVYVTDFQNNTVVGFAYDSNGALTSIPGQFVTVGTGPQVVFSPPAANFLYVGNEGTNDIYEFTINSDGSLVPVVGGTGIIGTGSGPIAMLSDLNAKYVYVLAHDSGQIFAYTLNRVTGTLTAIGPNGGAVSTGTGPVAFTIRSDGTTSGDYWVFASNLGANTISTFFLNGATGGLSGLPQLTVPGDGAPHGIVAH
jgi:DNA-binding beta-propeller fold protein YncE